MQHKGCAKSRNYRIDGTLEDNRGRSVNVYHNDGEKVGIVTAGEAAEQNVINIVIEKDGGKRPTRRTESSKIEKKTHRLKLF